MYLRSMSKLNDQRVEITKRIMEMDDARKLDAIASFLDGRGHLAFTAEEIAGFEAILAKHKAGDGRSVAWSTLKRRLRKDYPLR